MKKLYIQLVHRVNDSTSREDLNLTQLI